MKHRKYFGTVLLAVMFLASVGAAPSVAAGLDRNEEIERVMGDLAALTTAAQMHYDDHGTSRIPTLPSILSYFEDESMPRDAFTLYAFSASYGDWYVGYRTLGLRSETLRLLEDNADVLEIFADDLRSPWRRGSSYIWTIALANNSPTGGLVLLNQAPRTTIIRESGTNDFIPMLVAGSIFLRIIDRIHGHHYYASHRYPWQWRSTLSYRPIYRERFYGRFVSPRPPQRRVVHPPSRPAPPPRAIAPPQPRPGPVPVNRQPPRVRENPRQTPPRQAPPPRQQSPRMERPPRREAPRREGPRRETPRREAPRREESHRRRGRPYIEEEKK